MYVCYYFLNFLRDDEVGNDTFLASLVVCKESKILIKIFSTLKYNAKDLVREFHSKGWNVGLVYKLLQKKCRLLGQSAIVPASADDTAHALQLITLILFTNWYLTKVAKREIIFAHCT